MHERNAKPAAWLLCFALLLSGLVRAVPVQAASGQKITDLINTWERRYGSGDLWKVSNTSGSNPTSSHIAPSAALRRAVEEILDEYDLSPSNLQAYHPHLYFYVDKKGNPYWQIYFSVNQKEHPMLKPITVQIYAAGGGLRWMKAGSDG